MNLLESLSKIDSIEEQQHLSELQKMCTKAEKDGLGYDKNCSYARMYGIIPSLFGLRNSFYYPGYEHGLYLFDNMELDKALSKDMLDPTRACLITFGKFRKDILQNTVALPIFSVGPYIQYAKDYYSEEQYAKKKNTLGKNLLVFPSHTIMDANNDANEMLFMSQIQKKAKAFNSVTICVYWWNINDELVRKLKSEGYNIVSAGYRGDISFLDRLRTIISLSDMVVGDGMGTHIGYCVAIGKPYLHLEAETVLKSDRVDILHNNTTVCKHKTTILHGFSSLDNISEQNEIYHYYWGGGITRTRDELVIIWEINKSIIKRSLGFVHRYPTTARELLKEMESIGDELGTKLLHEGLS